jgi:hypothetical protein
MNTTDNSYTQQAETFISDASITFTAVLIGSDCPKFCEDARKGKEMDKVNVFPRKSHIHGKHYRVTFERRVKVSEADGKPVWSDYKRGPSLVVDFWNSYADEEFNALGSKEYRNGETHIKYATRSKHGYILKGKMCAPTAYDVLVCLTKSDPGTFEEFCGDMGLDQDSRCAEETWRAVMDEWVRVRRFFSADELGKLQEIN